MKIHTSAKRSNEEPYGERPPGAARGEAPCAPSAWDPGATAVVLSPDRSGRRRSPTPRAALIVLCALTFLPSALADMVTIEPSKDNTLYEDLNGVYSNGLGQYIFSGETAIGVARRAVLEFDVECHVPSGATITGATLTLSMDKTISRSFPIALHRIDAEWGEGASQASGQEGSGAISEPDDATWIHRFYDSTLWMTHGGDFQATASAATDVDQPGLYSWSSPGMIADVQGWLDAPGNNHGWILIGAEASPRSAKRFASRNHADPSVRPRLDVTFTAPGTPAGRVPDGGQTPGPPLRAAKLGGGLLSLTWSPSCRCTDRDYEIYEGSIGSYYSHAPVLCSTANATSASLLPAPGNRYYLVVPRNAAKEGSYGVRSNLLERSPAVAACLPQEFASCP